MMIVKRNKLYKANICCAIYIHTHMYIHMYMTRNHYSRQADKQADRQEEAKNGEIFFLLYTFLIVQLNETFICFRKTLIIKIAIIAATITTTKIIFTTPVDIKDGIIPG